MIFSLAPHILFAGSDLFVAEVRVVGLESISEQTVRSVVSTTPGKMTNRAKIRADIDALFRMGTFSDIQVDETRGENGWIYTFIFSEKAMVTKIEFEGNKKIKDKDLLEEVKVSLFQPLQESEVADAKEKIRKAYEKKRYYLVEVKQELKPSEEGGNILVFHIKEHERATIRYVNFIGNAVYTDQELRKKIKTKKKGGLGFITGSGKYKEEDLDQDVLRLTFHYLKNGYIHVKVKKPQVTLTKDRKYFFITFQVDEGDRYHLSTVDVDGDILTTKAELIAKLLSKPEAVYNRELIERDMQMLTQLYADLGYAFVHVQPQTITDEVKKTAALTYQIEKGNRIWIEKINIEGNTITRDKVIRRELEIKEGTLYNESFIAKSRQKVQSLGYFKDVNFATPRASRDDTIDLNINVEEQPTGNFSIGAGFSTAEDFILSGSVQKQNFFGRGWSGTISAELSNRRQQFLLNGVDPYFLDSEWIFGFSAFRTVFRYGSLASTSFDRESYGGSLSIGHRFFDYSSASFGYEAEQVDTGSLVSFIPPRFLSNASGLTSLVSLTLQRDQRDNRIYAKDGMFSSVKVETSGAKLGGDNDFFRVSGSNQFFQPVIGKLNFKTYGRIGYIKSLNNQVVPLFERYYLGGPNSLRGYFPQAIGPKETVTDTNGNLVDFVYGGDKMAVFNVELEHPIYDPAGLNFVTFFDAGNSFGEDSNLDFNNMRLDWGFGLRWISPMGPMRFEWGFPIDKQPGEAGTVFNFTIGSFF
ncbi:MAG: outer membrane protein assembly factor BamA [Deltaproteobacteria bacterium]|nr:outer membrane protein assembly factor BamA [Deltaproteobacteria bacterium]